MEWQIKFIIFLTGLLFVRGCRDAYGELRRRSVSEPFDERLANFFGSECDPLTKAASGVVPFLQSTVDYVLRDTKWYQQVLEKECTGELYVPECWIEALQYLLKTTSVLFNSSAECICMWSGSCGSMTENGRSKRSPTLAPSFPKLNNEETKFTDCLKKTVKQFIQQYPSLDRFDEESVTIFLKDHYTYCRGIPEIPYDLVQGQRPLPRFYLDKLCPRSGPDAEWRKDVIEVYIRATRNDGPLGNITEQCEPKGRCGPDPPIERECKNDCIPVVTEIFLEPADKQLDKLTGTWKPESIARCYYVMLVRLHTCEVLKKVPCIQDNIIEFNDVPLLEGDDYGLLVSAVSVECKRGRPGFFFTVLLPHTQPTVEPSLTFRDETDGCGCVDMKELERVTKTYKERCYSKLIDEEGNTEKDNGDL